MAAHSRPKKHVLCAALHQRVLLSLVPRFPPCALCLIPCLIWLLRVMLPLNSSLLPKGPAAEGVRGSAYLTDFRTRV
eukprot:COSAG01_NODE_1941_length_8843_cov_33.836802_13_plen_77_part_00